MTSFDAAFKRLSALTNYERKKPDRPHRFDLGGMTRLCADLGHPELDLGTVVQVAGSKGKGTVTWLLAAMARATGLRSASYYSPHVRDVRERISLNGRQVAGHELAPHIERVVGCMRDECTWFEAFTAAALLCFREAAPDLCVLEVGLGGRLDSTSIVPKHACCITGIELEHTHVLGDTIEAIASEKAGILRAGVPCVTGAKGQALSSIEGRADELGLPVVVLGRDVSLDVAGEPGDLLVHMKGRVNATFRTPLYASVHARSFALAYLLFCEVFPDRANALRDLDAMVWLSLPPARFQVLERDPAVVVDGAHTDDSLATLADDLTAAFPDTRFRLVFAVAAGKRWQRGLGSLARLVDTAWVAPLEGKEGVAPEELREFLQALGVPCVATASIAVAVSEATRATGSTGLLVTGSLYAAGDALRVLEENRGAGTEEMDRTCQSSRRSQEKGRSSKTSS